MKHVGILLFSLFMFFNIHADNKTIVLNMGGKDYPPYLILKDDKKPEGIMYEVLQSIASKYNYVVVPARVPRKRVTLFIINGKLDATPRAKQWTKNPDDFLFTDKIIDFKDLIFYLKTNKLIFNDVKDLFGKRISTHTGYKYPLLEKYFKTNKIKRDDSNYELSMIRKVIAKRTDGVIINEKVGEWLLKTNGWTNKFEKTDKDLGNVGYRIMFSKKWKPFVDNFNKELENMKKNGELDKILNKYK